MAYIARNINLIKEIIQIIYIHKAHVLGMGIDFADYKGNTEIIWPLYLNMGLLIYICRKLIWLLKIGYKKFLIIKVC